MNITQMMRGLLGDVKSGDSRKVELKAGQVVRGVVMKVDSESKDAIVQINGIQVRAKLETPLSPGQTAMLKVQPESTADTIVLKQVETAADQASEDSIRQLVKASGMPEAKWAMDIIRDLKRDGIPLTRDVVQALKQAVESMPKGVDPEEWMKAAAVALRRGMPVTEQTVAGMRQVMYGKPVHQLLEELETQLADFIEVNDSGVEGETSEQVTRTALQSQTSGLADTAARLKAILSEMKASTTNLANVEQTDTTPDAATGGVQRWKPEQLIPNVKSSFNPVLMQKAAYEAMELPDDSAESISNRGNTGAAIQADNTAAKVVASSTSPTLAAASSIGNDTSVWVGKMLQLLGVNHEQQLLHETARQLVATASDNKAAASTPVTTQAAEDTTAQTKQSAATGSVPMGTDVEQLVSRPSGTGITGTGLNASEDDATVKGEQIKPAYDRIVNGQPQTQAASKSTVPGRTSALLQDALASHQPDDGMSAPLQNGIRPAEGSVSETLKSALLSLASMDDAPAPLKETAQQLIHQITGQQLMLAPERNGSVLTHVTLFIPIQDENGSQTASVHVQTRRGSKNELDASNCRLLFDLHLKVLGDTVVDVHVVDKIVNLNVWNDHPVMGQIADHERGAVAEALNRAGYQLLTFNVRPATRVLSDGDTLVEGSNLSLPDFPAYGGTPYKGVDIKI